MAAFLNHKKQNVQTKRLKNFEDTVKLLRSNAQPSFTSASFPNLIKIIIKKEKVINKSYRAKSAGKEST